ncbi:anaerobic ribonucleoside-triphosphate reductase activating protein [Anaeroplasma bactoclasticum]|uniref:Anaerobic ribonucleoside-triphosphate reductase-activating protein n=1 Tax=Anaeroplasma bactoclasticum TaxID=2088 RepID=A0A397QY52_9MOLU|nr:anaerobic ribonucleoside-triphosphate reductase activating protein [Anaeroplasma bactoclasticum]RIA64845.1 anaerobic ribonucleoside-triphosphate reductase activating protein [Anaeroplasma bactoclasticum]
MRFNKVRKMDISNGPGVRVAVFFQGCPFHCPGCFNQDTWDFDGGKDYTCDIENKILEFCGKEYINGLSILGGEPMAPANIDSTIHLAKRFKEMYPNKSLWCWSGYNFDEICNKDILKYADVIVDGRFDKSKRDPRLKYAGSTNQRAIDVKRTIQNGKITLYED